MMKMLSTTKTPMPMKNILEHVSSFKNALDEAGSPFEEDDILVHVVSRQIMSETSVKIAYDTGKKQ